MNENALPVFQTTRLVINELIRLLNAWEDPFSTKKNEWVKTTSLSVQYERRLIFENVEEKFNPEIIAWMKKTKKYWKLESAIQVPIFLLHPIFWRQEKWEQLECTYFDTEFLSPTLNLPQNFTPNSTERIFCILLLFCFCFSVSFGA